MGITVNGERFLTCRIRDSSSVYHIPSVFKYIRHGFIYSFYSLRSYSFSAVLIVSWLVGVTFINCVVCPSPLHPSTPHPSWIFYIPAPLATILPPISCLSPLLSPFSVHPSPCYFIVSLSLLTLFSFLFSCCAPCSFFPILGSFSFFFQIIP